MIVPGPPFRGGAQHSLDALALYPRAAASLRNSTRLAATDPPLPGLQLFDLSFGDLSFGLILPCASRVRLLSRLSAASSRLERPDSALGSCWTRLPR
ncbi:MAG: hypothetical protein WKF82_06060 [Nocardioidaceae bacterium]